MKDVVFVLYPGFQLLDMAGAAAVFAGVERQNAKLYRVVCVSAAGGAVVSAAGIAIETEATAKRPFAATDTMVVPGADEGVRRLAMADTTLIDVLRAAAETAERVAAVCTGAFLLAAAGLLDGKRAATHWASADAFTKAFPQVTLASDAIFVEDGGVWTSAGTTTGIDMALDIVKRDHGNAPAHDVARLLRGSRARARIAGQAG